ncbi:MAG: chemotaxis protein CheW [Planctomycetota bacterium]
MMTASRKDPISLDWAQIRSRLEQTLKELQGEPSKSQIDEILAHRARILAKTPDGELFREGDIHLLTFLTGAERYALAAEHVRSVTALGEYTPIPCTPPFVLGVFNVRGQVYSLVDIRLFLGLPVESRHVYRKAMLVEVPGMEVGFAVDEVFDVIGIRPEDLAWAGPSQYAIDGRYVRGLTRDLVLVLDLPAILRDPRFLVHEEVGAAKVSA